MPEPQALTAVLWDFGGVILSSPFEAFNRYESEQGLPLDFIRSVNATNPHHNAWARLERNEVSPLEFDDAFAADSEELGHRIPGRDVLALSPSELEDYRGGIVSMIFQPPYSVPTAMAACAAKMTHTGGASLVASSATR